MANLPTKVYGNAGLKAVTGAVDYTTTINATLHTNAGYTPNQDTHVFRSDLAGELSTANGYTAGGAACTLPSPTYDAATHTARVAPGGSVVWTLSGTINARWAVFSKHRGGSATLDELLCYVDMNSGTAADISIPTGTFTLTFDATGLVKDAAS